MNSVVLHFMRRTLRWLSIFIFDEGGKQVQRVDESLLNALSYMTRSSYLWIFTKTRTVDRYYDVNYAMP